MQVFFSIGMSKNATVNGLVRKEAAIFKDILQEDYIDSYYIMSAKIMGALEWASTDCRNTRFLLRINDDAVLNTVSFVRFLRDKVQRANGREFTRAIMGTLVQRVNVERDPNHKFYVSWANFFQALLPPYRGGSFYLVTADLAAEYANLSQYVQRPPFSVWLEDIYMGMLS
jgi:hypothetical protein